MIDQLTLKMGPRPGAPAITITLPTITVFVGPNNSGKSKLLQEIREICEQGQVASSKILDTITFSQISREDALRQLDAIRSKPRPGEALHANLQMVQVGAWRDQISTSQYIQARVSPNEPTSRRYFCQYFARHLTANIDGASRMRLVADQPRGDLKYPTSSFARLLTDDSKRTALRSTVFDAVSLYLGIDMSNGSNLELRFGVTAPPSERSVDEHNLEWMRNAIPATEVSDGIKAFSGILTELSAGDSKIVIIDEPEAFLHPSLAFRLGKEIAKTATEGGKHVFVATHSAQFLMGAIQSGAKVDVVRLTYQNGVGTARLLENASVYEMMKDPLLRSANAMAGIFYANVVVTEADADRAFHQELNERLLEYSPGRGIPNALFVNGNGKDTVHRIVAPLRRLGIPTAAVFDIDVLKAGVQAGKVTCRRAVFLRHN